MSTGRNCTQGPTSLNRVLADTTVADLLAAAPSLEDAYFALTRDAVEFRGEAAR